MTLNTPFAQVIGDPIAQSKSPLIHKFWLEKLDIEGRYERAQVLPEKLGDYLAERKGDPDWRGCNVTLPHKIAIMDYVDDPGHVKDTIGAMNTIIRQPDGNLMGTNTDAAGFYAPIADIDWAGKHAIMLGAGGAARAVLFALKKAGIGEVTILARSALKATGLLASFGLKGKILPMDTTLPVADLLVNASPLGMIGKPALDIDLSTLPAGAVIYDLVYSPLETDLLKAAKKRNLESVDGLDMLIGQAALAFELFFGKAPPLEHDKELKKLLMV